MQNAPSESLFKPRPVRKLMAVQAPPAARLPLRSFTRLTSEVMPMPAALANSSTFVSVRRLCSTACLHTAMNTVKDAVQNVKDCKLGCQSREAGVTAGAAAANHD